MTQDNDRWTPMQAIVGLGSPKAAHIPYDGKTPLDYAYQNGNPEIIAALEGRTTLANDKSCVTVATTAVEVVDPKAIKGWQNMQTRALPEAKTKKSL